ncbi:hypothetical protein Pla110_24910 [Polystyrenella longa]|uniref:Uncharacterized protein n=1 Tax=Polystyrenella longa TaxID=2528007 RepID=A0A518CNH0_9PLAN|nr:hypothetical protein Pla110_24910 [Polystyrenella longa]
MRLFWSRINQHISSRANEAEAFQAEEQETFAHIKATHNQTFSEGLLDKAPQLKLPLRAKT